MADFTAPGDLSVDGLDVVLRNGTWSGDLNSSRGAVNLFKLSGFDSTLSLGYQDGYDAGFNAGYGLGDDAGYQSGYSSAYDVAFAPAYENGLAVGSERGPIDGTSDGFDAGWEDGSTDGATVGFEEGYAFLADGGLANQWVMNQLEMAPAAFARVHPELASQLFSVADQLAVISTVVPSATPAIDVTEATNLMIGTVGITILAVPEPTSLGLFLMGGLWLLRGRRTTRMQVSC
jgi:hypothetical protein